jgi:hypothetical protein
MSLKAFHIVFITASILLAFGFGGWLFKSFSDSGSLWALLCGVVSVAAGVGLIVYERQFLKKTKHIGYI